MSAPGREHRWSFVIGVPVVMRPSRVRTSWERWDVTPPERLFLIDNTADGSWRPIAAEHGWSYYTAGRNLGVARSWNVALQQDAAMTALVSSSVVFHDGMSSLVAAMKQQADWQRGLLTDDAFHAAAWARPLIDVVGLFDENFWPGYFEDNDWIRRLELAGMHTPANPMPKAYLATSCDNAVALRSGAIAQPDFRALLDYYVSKWGGPPGQETYATPYNEAMPLSFWRHPDGGANT